MVKRLIQKTSTTDEQKKQDILNHTENREGCMEWKGARATDGYPTLYGNRKVHRIIYQLHTNEDISDFVIRHTCDNILCINPEHLIKGTPAQNNQDRADRGRSYRTTTPDKIKRVNELLETSVLSQKEIALLVELDQRRVSDIKRKLYSPDGRFLGRKKVG